MNKANEEKKRKRRKKSAKANVYCLNCVIPVMYTWMFVDVGSRDAVYGIMFFYDLPDRSTFPNMPFYWSITLIKKELNATKSHRICCLKVCSAPYTPFLPNILDTLVYCTHRCASSSSSFFILNVKYLCRLWICHNSFTIIWSRRLKISFYIDINIRWPIYFLPHCRRYHW